MPTDELKIQRIAGGSVTYYPPLFSPDGETLFVIWRNIIQMYSATTGEWLKNLEGTEDRIISIYFDIYNPKIIIGCTKTGEVVSWKWKSAVIATKVKLFPDDKNVRIKTFNLIDIDGDQINGFITWSSKNDENLTCSVYNLTNGKCYKKSIDSLYLKNSFIRVTVSKAHKFLCLIQFNRIFFVDTIKWYFKRILAQVTFSSVVAHPLNLSVATGNSLGKVTIWNDIFADRPIQSEYHWHFSKLQAITFSDNGSNLYTGGQECVLVKWNLTCDEKSFLPRLSDNIVGLSISSQNDRLAVSTNDNAIQIFNLRMQPISILQNFTRVNNDRTGLNPFPVGLQVNPRNNVLVLNGREGHLQFYSPHTRSLLFNLDIVKQNRITETIKVIFGTRIKNVALNTDWMATVEMRDDLEYSLEIRLKFWEFDKEKQNYSLNTNIESPHEKGINDIKFSNSFNVDNLLCATAGEDNRIKIWSLDNSNDIYKKRYSWVCVGKIEYKEMQINSISFTQDGSLLSAGFGNTLCLYTTDNLQLKCALSVPSGLDGNINKAVIKLPESQKSNISLNKKNLQIIKNKEMLTKSLLENNDISLIKNFKAKSIKTKYYKCYSNKKLLTKKDLSKSDKEIIFERILSSNELNLDEKYDLFTKLNIHLNLFNKDNLKNKLIDYITNKNNAEGKLYKNIDNLSKRYKFLMHRNIFALKKTNMKYKTMESPVLNIVNKLRLNGHTNSEFKLNKPACNGFTKHNALNNNNNSNDVYGDNKLTMSSKINHNIIQKTNDENNIKFIRKLTNIKHVLFGTGEFRHLVIMSTEHKLLIWNLLTLRLQTAVKLSVKKMIIDQHTSLLAVFTQSNELFIFLPNVTIPLYHRKDMPHIFGAAWVPRRYPKPHSINLDWQATSQLIFLNSEQELLQLAADNDDDYLMPATDYINTTSVEQYTPFGAIIAKQMQNAALNNQTKNFGGALSVGIPGKSAVKEFIGFTTHTMAPMNLLCKSFLKSLLITDGGKDKDDKSIANNDNDEDEVDDLEDAMDENSDDKEQSDNDKLITRKTWLNTIDKITKKNIVKNLANINEEIVIDKQLRHMLINENINFQL